MEQAKETHMENVIKRLGHVAGLLDNLKDYAGSDVIRSSSTIEGGLEKIEQDMGRICGLLSEAIEYARKG